MSSNLKKKLHNLLNLVKAINDEQNPPASPQTAQSMVQAPPRMLTSHDEDPVYKALSAELGKAAKKYTETGHHDDHTSLKEAVSKLAVRRKELDEEMSRAKASTGGSLISQKTVERLKGTTPQKRTSSKKQDGVPFTVEDAHKVLSMPHIDAILHTHSLIDNSGMNQNDRLEARKLVNKSKNSVDVSRFIVNRLDAQQRAKHSRLDREQEAAKQQQDTRPTFAGSGQELQALPAALKDKYKPQ